MEDDADNLRRFIYDPAEYLRKLYSGKKTKKELQRELRKNEYLKKQRLLT
jgi:hypothetical protein